MGSLCLTHVCIIGFYPGGPHVVSGVLSLSTLVRLLGTGQVQVSGQSPPSPPTHLVKVVLNVQDLLGQQSQATEQHSWGLVNHRQVDQPGRGKQQEQRLVSGLRP